MILQNSYLVDGDGDYLVFAVLRLIGVYLSKSLFWLPNDWDEEGAMG